MKKIIVTAADENFFPLLSDLIQSLKLLRPMPFDAIGVLDLGLSPASLEKLSGQVAHVVSPGWDLPLDPSLQLRMPYLRALTSRPFLPRYFPGYDYYLWLDADTWVQEKFAIDWFFTAAQTGDMALVPQIDRSYIHTARMVKWRKNYLFQSFGEEAIALYEQNTYFNAGAFALHRDALHWGVWEKFFRLAVKKNLPKISDQAVLNFAIWKENLRVHPLPALCNWCCHLALPAVDVYNGKLCEPHFPHRPLGLIHMTAGTKDRKLKFVYQGLKKEVSLSFAALQRLAEQEALQSPDPAMPAPFRQ